SGPASRGSSFQVRVPQTRTIPDCPPATSVLPSGAKAREATPSDSPGQGDLPVAVSHNRTFRSSPPVITTLPSPLRARQVTGFEEGGILRVSFPVSTSQRRTAASSPAEARSLPSAEKDRPATAVPWFPWS